MATKEVKKLAALARISIPDSELEKFTKEFDAILAYVGQLEKLELPLGAGALPSLRNVMREDEVQHAPGEYTEKITEQFSAREGNALSVKQIINYESAE